jgi:retron-type reverse transcriptase
MLRGGYANRGRDEWAVHAGGSKDLQQTNKTQEKNTPCKVRPTKRIYLSKANGKQRLGISTIKYRVMQAVVKNALEPSWDDRFESNSCRFRAAGRSCHNAIE